MLADDETKLINIVLENSFISMIFYILRNYSKTSEYFGSNGGIDNDNYTYRTSENGRHKHDITIDIDDAKKEIADESHENKPPFMVLCYIIRCC